MTKYTRTNPSITDIEPIYAQKVFQFLNIWFNKEKVSVKFLKENLNKFDRGQQYFIVKYGQSYFDTENPSSFIVNRLEEMESSFEDIVDQEDSENQYEEFLSHKNILVDNVLESLEYLRTIKPSVYQDYRYYKKHSLPKSLWQGVQSSINFKIPVYFNQTDFKDCVFEKLAPFYTNKQIDDFYNNSFRHTVDTFPPKLLNLLIKNSGDLYKAIYDIYDFRLKEVSFRLKVAVENFNAKNKDKRKRTENELRKKFIADLKFQKLKKYQVMYVMYNSFPQIRNTYRYSSAQNPEQTLESYLNTKSRNIKA